MDAVALIQATIARRTAQGFSFSAHGKDGYTEARPFTYHATTAADYELRTAQFRAKGFTVEQL